MENNNVAVFIDAENVGAQHAGQIFETASNYGDVIVKRAYGDWSKRNLAPWKEAVEKYSITAEQQHSFAKGKNSSDILLIIDIMRMLFEKNLDTFVVVSGDSDFTRLIQELKERGKNVIGMGAKTAINNYVNSFSEFIYLTDENAQKTSAKNKESDKNKQSVTSQKIEKSVNEKPQCPLEDDRLHTLCEIADNLIDQSGKALYAQLSTSMKNKYSDFIPQNYGCKRFGILMQKLLPFLPQYKEEKENLDYYLVNK